MFRKIGKRIRTLLPHAVVVLSGLFIILSIADRFNPTMNFINNDISKALLLLFALVSIANSCFVIHQNRKQFRARQERETRRDGRTEE